MSYGFAGYIGLGRETSWGSGTNPGSGDFVEALSEDVTLTMERFSHKAIIASMGEPDDSVGMRRIGGSIKFAAHPTPLGHFLKMALQSVTRVASSPIWTHSFITTSGGDDFSAVVPHQPYTIEIFSDVTSAVQYSGCLVDALTLSYAQGAAVMVDARIIGRGQRAVTRSTATFPSTPAKPFTFDTVSLSLGGAATALIESLDVTINNNLTGLGALNMSTDIAKVRRQNHQMVSIRGVLDFTNITEYLAFVNQTEQRLTVSAFRADSFSLIVDIPRMVYTAFPLTMPGRERNTIQFEGKGFVHTGSGNAITVRLTNTKSFY